MCTVSFIKKEDTFFITSNRDEHISRRTAFEPRRESVDGRELIFPKDPKGGGTWFAVNEEGTVIVLLNGAYKKHIPTGNYAKSRGLIVLDVAAQDDASAYLKAMDLTNIEPFTLLVFQERRLFELLWDGHKKTIKERDTTVNHIWSSVTLYDTDAIQKREALFKEFLKTEKIDVTSITDFHSNSTDSENGFIIDRKTGLKTFSVTQAILSNDTVCLRHKDLLTKKTNNLTIYPKETAPSA